MNKYAALLLAALAAVIATCLSCPLPEPKCSSSLCPLQAGKPPKHRKKKPKKTVRARAKPLT